MVTRVLIILFLFFALSEISTKLTTIISLLEKAA